VKGGDRPKDAAERLAFARMCGDTQRYATAARLWDEVLAVGLRLVIPIGNSEPVSIFRGEPPNLSSILVSAAEALFSRRFVLGLVPLESQAGMDLVPSFDRVAELSCQIDPIPYCWPT
jgi:hypothetical protein